MIPADLIPLMPLLVLAATAVLGITVIALFRNRLLVTLLSCAGFAGAIAACIVTVSPSARTITPLLVVDTYALFFTVLISLAGGSAALLAFDYFSQRDDQYEEFFVFLLLATLGAAVLAWSSHFASFFLGLELLSISLYVLIAYRRSDRAGTEAGVKYLVLSAVAAALLLFGMALLYAESGTMELSGVKEFFNVRPASALSLLGLTLLLVGIGFKLALVPFHFWTPEIYQGAPAPVATFIATVSKTGIFALFMRYFAPVGSFPGHAPVLALTVIAIASMFIGNLLGLLQNNIKRILAYSSIAHMGYFLAAFLSGQPFGVMAAIYYLTAYVLTVIVAFGTLSALSASGDAETIDDVRGLARRSPWLAIPLAVAFASLAGLPLAAGFIGKFFVIAAGALSHSWTLAFCLIISSGIGIFYYFRVAAALFEKLPDSTSPESADKPAGKIPLLTTVVIWVTTAAIVFLGVFPSRLTALIRSIIEG